MFDIEYPEVSVQLTGHDGGAFSIIGRISQALRREVSAEAAEKFRAAAYDCNSYDALLQLAMRTVNVS